MIASTSFIPLLIRKKLQSKRGSIDCDCDCSSIPCVILSLVVFIPSVRRSTLLAYLQKYITGWMDLLVGWLT